MIIKFFGVILIILSGVLFGFSVKYKQYLRFRELQNFFEIVDVIYKEICVGLCDFKEALIKANDYASKYNSKIIKSALDLHRDSDGESINALWNSAIDRVREYLTPYDENDVNLLKKFAVKLSCNDVELQKKNINEFKNVLTEHMANVKNRNDKIALIPKISFYAGIIVAIVLF